MKKLKGTFITMLLVKEAHLLEHDPQTQYKFNRFWAMFWLLQMPLVLVLMLAFPHFWLAIFAIYVTEASLWANFSTHFGAMSSSLAAINTTGVVKEVVEDVHDIAEDVTDLADDVDDVHNVAQVLHPELIAQPVPVETA